MSEVDAAIAAARALIAKDEKIERLEAELAEVTEHRDNMLQRWVEADEANNKLRAELAACEQVREAIAAESRDRYAELAETRSERDLRISIEAELRDELADLRHKVKMQDVAQSLQDQVLADLRASSVVYKVRCETCGGSGVVADISFDSNEDFGDKPCPDCDNGWQLAEGVVKFEGIIGFQNQGPHYSIPARLIEGDTDE